MSRHFSANQFESAYAPDRLCNWEVPKNHRTKPLVRKGSTKIVSNDRGHLLPGIPRPKTSSCGDFLNTWQLPKRITRDAANQLNSTKKHIHPNTSKAKLPEADVVRAKATDAETDKELRYTPGDLTQPTQQHSSRAALAKSGEIRLPELNDLYVERESKGPHPKDHFGELLAKVSAERQSYRGYKPTEHRAKQEGHPANSTDAEHSVRSERDMRHELVSDKPGECNTIPIIPAHCNFEIARRMAQENLEHQPLPDSIMDRTFLKMQALGMANPELSLNVEPTATGVGVKTHNAGPTHCTKMKVYRPKTCGIVPPPFDDASPHELRPLTGVPYRKARIEPMDLAICWDYRPANAGDEPREPPHIDGSYDTVAPAIFNVVKTPRQTPSAQQTGRSAGVFAHTGGEDGFFDKDIMLRNRSYFGAQLHRGTDRTCKCGSAVRRPSPRRALNGRCQSSPDLSVPTEPSDVWTPHESIIVCNYNKEHCHYQPKAPTGRPPAKKPASCAAKPTARLCQQNLAPPNAKCKKHGAKGNGSLCSSLDNASKCGTGTGSEFTSTLVRIPKPRHPYAKKSYTIDTLAPPFACWKGGAGQGGYPEHWRLASVYQHAYKPPEQRKRPLLATVYQ